MGHAVAAPPEPLTHELVIQASAGTSEATGALSPDGHVLAVSSSSFTHLYNTQSGQLRRILRGGGLPIWSPDGKVLAVGGDGVRLWQMPAAKLLRFEKRGGGGVSFDRSGRYFVCGRGPSGDKGVVFETASGRIEGKWGARSEGDFYPVGFYSGGEQAVLSPDARRCLTYSKQDYRDGKLVRATLWDVMTGHLLREYISPHSVFSAAWSPAGGQIALGQESNNLTLWNPDNGSTKQLLDGPTGSSYERVRSVLFSGDGKTLVSSSDDRTLRFWSMPSGKLSRVLPVPRGVDSYFLGASADLTLLTLRSYRSGVALLNGRGEVGSDLSKDSPPSLPSALSSVSVLAWSPDGKLLAHGAGTALRIWDWQKGTLRSAPPILGTLAGLSFGGGELRAALGIYEYDSSRGEVWAWNVGTGHLRAAWSLGGPISDKERTRDAPNDFSLGGRWTAHHALYDTRFSLHDARTGKFGRVLKVPDQGMSLAFASDDWAATAERDETIRVWNLKTGAHRIAHRNSVNNDFEAGLLSFSPRLNWIAGGGRWGLRVWAARGQDRERQLSNEGVTALDFSPNEKLLASGSETGEVALWQNTVPGTPKARRLVLGHHQGSVARLRFSPDGRFLASGGDDGTLRIWEISHALTKPDSVSATSALRLTIWNLPSDKSETPQWFALASENRWTGSTGAAQYVWWRARNAGIDQPLSPLEIQSATRDDALLKALLSQ